VAAVQGSGGRRRSLAENRCDPRRTRARWPVSVGAVESVCRDVLVRPGELATTPCVGPCATATAPPSRARRPPPAAGHGPADRARAGRRRGDAGRGAQAAAAAAC
jgi:hypothetical protein